MSERTKAILFLGTPHRGSNFGTWGWWAAQALRPLGSNPLLLADLEYDSTPLLDLHRAFVRTATDDLRVFNFFEERPLLICRLWFVQWQQFVSTPCRSSQTSTDNNCSVFESHLPRMRDQESRTLALPPITTG